MAFKATVIVKCLKKSTQKACELLGPSRPSVPDPDILPGEMRNVTIFMDEGDRAVRRCQHRIKPQLPPYVMPR